jgi:hypothetical protein
MASAWLPAREDRPLRARGGAVQLSAAGTLTLSGTLVVAGGGGRGGNTRAGGGGSGGGGGGGASGRIRINAHSTCNASNLSSPTASGNGPANGCPAP